MERCMEEMCKRMDSKTLKAYKSLHNSHTTDGSGPLLGIRRTNGFDVEVIDPHGLDFGGPDAAHYSCVGKIGSRLNHEYDLLYSLSTPLLT